MPTKLDERLVADALTALRHWTGDATGITRTVELPEDRSEAVLREVAVSAGSLAHHPEVERAGTRTTFTLRTGSEGGVTELDIALASRIDDIVRRVGGVADAAPTPPGRSRAADATVVASAVEEGHGREWEPSPADPAEPFVGVPSARAGVPAVPEPDPEPGAPEPGVQTPEGRQGG